MNKGRRCALHFGKSDYIKERAKKRKRSSEPIADDDLGLPSLRPSIEL